MMPALPFANITHLGWAVRDIDKTVKNFEDLGLGPWRRYVLGETKNRAEVALARWGAIVVELFQPISMPMVSDFLEKHGEGIWHFGYSMSREQFDATLAEMEKKGIKVTGHSQYKNGVRMAFLDPAKTGGIIFQLHDTPPEVENLLDTMGVVLG